MAPRAKITGAPEGGAKPLPFWRTKTLSRMTRAEWESLCDGCGKCCLHKVEYVNTNEVFYSDIACKLLDLATCRCGDYANRVAKVPDCAVLKPRDVARYTWLPTTCAYRLVHEGKDLPAWHHLVCGDAQSVHQAGMSVRGRAVAEGPGLEPENRFVTWPE